jgi:hypothetical protein
MKTRELEKKKSLIELMMPYWRSYNQSLMKIWAIIDKDKTVIAKRENK